MANIGGVAPGALLAHRYLLGAALGQGGMGRVYAATDLHTGGPVAVKLLHPSLASTDTDIERLRREARIAAALTSPRIVRMIDLATDPATGAVFLVQEYVAGRTLAQILDDRGMLSVDEALGLCREIAAALEAAHAAGVVHRDLKPQNVMLVDGQVKVLDFGIARGVGDVTLTAASLYVGTPAYSAPERAEGPGDIRADLYALGVILYELLAGVRPFDGPTPLAVLHRHATEQPPPLPSALPAPVRALVARCLAKDPTDRYQTPAELGAALDAIRRSLPRSATAPTPEAGGPATRTVNLGAAPRRRASLSRARSVRVSLLALPVVVMIILAVEGLLARDYDGAPEHDRAAEPTPTAVAMAQRVHLQLDGLDDYVEVPDSDDFSVTTTGALTIAARMRPETLTFPSSEGTGYVHWLGKGETRQHEWTFRMHSLGNTEDRGNRIAFYVFNPGGGSGIGSYFEDPVTAGEWIHVVGIVDSERTYIYKNGRQRDDDLYRGTITPANGSAPLRMGKRNGPVHFHGGLADVRIWNRPLTRTEVADLYASNTVPRDGLVAEWLLTEDTDTIAHDTAGVHDGSIIR